MSAVELGAPSVYWPWWMKAVLPLASRNTVIGKFAATLSLRAIFSSGSS